MAVRIFASIDVGSFELELGIYEMSYKTGIRRIDHVRHVIPLGKDTYSAGKISYELAEEMCRVLEGFVEIMKSYRVKDYRAYATSAMREARNRQMILEQIRVRTGLTVRVISNSEQRFISYKAIAVQAGEFNRIIQKGTAIVDVGFGSTQLSLFDKDRLVTTENIRMGIIRIRERLQRLEDRPSYMVPLIEELVNSEIGAFQRMYVKDREIRSVILIGDYINYVVRRYRKKPEGDTPFVTKEELMADMEQLIALSPAQIAKRLEIPAENESMILPALVVYRKLLKDTPAELIWAPGLNLSDGLAYDYAEQHKIIRGSHNFENDILAAAKNIAKRYQADRPHVAHVADLALTIFDAMRKPAGLKDRDRLLLNISVQLHHCGKFITISKAPECNYNIIMSTEIIGLSHKERNLVANIVRYVITDFAGFDELAAKEDIEEESYLKIAKLVAILRVANTLDRSHKQKIREMKASLKGSQLVLE